MKIVNYLTAHDHVATKALATELVRRGARIISINPVFGSNDIWFEHESADDDDWCFSVHAAASGKKEKQDGKSAISG